MEKLCMTERKTSYNSTYPKGGVSCSKDSFVDNQTLVFQVKFCGKSPALRVAANRWVQAYLTGQQTTNKQTKLAHALMAHLVLPETQADPSQNQKSHFLPTLWKTVTNLTLINC